MNLSQIKQRFLDNKKSYGANGKGKQKIKLKSSNFVGGIFLYINSKGYFKTYLFSATFRVKYVIFMRYYTVENCDIKIISIFCCNVARSLYVYNFMIKFISLICNFIKRSLGPRFLLRFYVPIFFCNNLSSISSGLDISDP